jgi:hypothetical protein
MIREHDRVVLTAPMPSQRLQIGDVGTVVHVYGDGKAFEIEFTTLASQTVAVATLDSSVVRLVTDLEVDEA